ncbi:MAG: TlpA family protein disulfide reductase [Actinomycetia bacterium]|nr:TlpA family protein disulfide reductase [Actinomycetes bacterium]
MIPRTRLLIPLMALAVLAAACGSDATTAAGASHGTDDDSIDEPTETTALDQAADPPAEPLAVGAVEVSGDPLPVYTDSADPAIGSPAPLATSVDFSGQPTEIAADGRAKVLVFVAHWCSHCQDEVPRLTHWLDDGNKPDSVDFITIVTAIDPTASNYPPSAWLGEEHLDTPMLLDDEASTLLNAFGLSAFPFWVVIDADGNVVGRTSGGLGAEGFDAMAAAAVTGEGA